jgi:hypothetical protein
MSRVNTYLFATYSYPVVGNSVPGTTASGSIIDLIATYVPPNLFRPGDTIELTFMISDNSSASSGQKICYWNSGTTSLTGAIYLAQWVSAVATAGTQPVTRYIHIASPTQSYTVGTSSSLLTQISNTDTNTTPQTINLVSVNIDWTVPSYFFVRSGVTGDRGQYIYLNRK